MGHGVVVYPFDGIIHADCDLDDNENITISAIPVANPAATGTPIEFATTIYYNFNLMNFVNEKKKKKRGKLG